jgi:hypothetical protein
VPGTGTEFDPGAYNTGEPYIVSQVLPGAAESVKAGASGNAATFKNFSALKEVSGANIETIGEYAFYGCTALTEVDFPLAQTIGTQAFYDCTALTEASFPLAQTTGNYAFYRCTALTEVDFPLAESIGALAFYGCTVLTDASFPAVTSIGARAFHNTGTAALTLTLPKAAPSVSAGSLSSNTYSKTVTIKTPADSTGYDTTWETNFKKAFGGNATITLKFEDL